MRMMGVGVKNGEGGMLSHTAGRSWWRQRCEAQRTFDMQLYLFQQRSVDRGQGSKRERESRRDVKKERGRGKRKGERVL